jgi:hypothetical protein
MQGYVKFGRYSRRAALPTIPIVMLYFLVRDKYYESSYPTLMRLILLVNQVKLHCSDKPFPSREFTKMHMSPQYVKSGPK